MAIDASRIQKGMDVYGMDGEKIGTVADGPSHLKSTRAEGQSGGGEGALGDEDRVAASPGGGGTGALGNESRVATEGALHRTMGDEAMVPEDAGAEGGAGTLGDEDRVASDYGPAGTLGDESRVPADGGVAGGGGALGDESAVQGTYSRPTNDAPLGITAPSSSQTNRDVGVFESGDTTFVEQGPSGMVDTQNTRIGGSTDATGPTQSGYAGPGSLGTVVTGSTAEDYFEVDHGGFLGIGTKALYVPFSAVQDISPDGRITLNCTKDECESRFAEPS